MSNCEIALCHLQPIGCLSVEHKTKKAKNSPSLQLSQELHGYFTECIYTNLDLLTSGFAPTSAGVKGNGNS